MKFATRYNPNKKVCSVMDSKDNVDRLSYVDSTQMVKRMIYEGQNLMEYRAKALRSGMYGIDDLANDETVPSLPVYHEDPVIMQGIYDMYKAELTSSTAKRAEDSATVEAESISAESVESDSQGGE